MTFKVLVTDKLSKKATEILKSYSSLEVVEKDTLPPEELKKEIKDYHGIIIRSQTKLTREIIECADNLKVISRAGVGVDNIDIPAATEKGIVVMNAPSGNTISTAELAFALMITLARKIPFAYKSMQEGKWARKDFKGVELNGKTLGVIGMGRIGTEVVKRAKAFNMDILAFDPYLAEEKAEQMGIKIADLEEIYKNSDFITIHTPMTDQTRGMIGLKELKMMKPSMLLVNAARGGIVVEEDLATALKEGIIAGAAIDVWSSEPPFEPRNPILDAPNVVTVPHIGASTEEAQLNVAEESAHGMGNFLQNNVVVNSINMPSLDKESYEQLSAHIKLSEKIGSMIGQLIPGQINEITLSISGEITNYDTSMITRAAVKGLFGTMDDTVNYVNAINVAKSRGIKVTEQKQDTDTDFGNLVCMEVKSGKATYELRGTVYSNRLAKLVKFNDFYFELDPKGIMVVIQNEDRPGVVGKVGTLLGKNNVNVAEMRLGRNDTTREVLTILSIDNDLDEKVLEELKRVEEIKSALVVKL